MGFVSDIVDGLKDGTLRRREVEAAAARDERVIREQQDHIKATSGTAAVNADTLARHRASLANLRQALRDTTTP